MNGHLQRRTVTLIALVAMIIFINACAKKTRPAAVVAPRIGNTENGVASWYGIPYHGRRAANGETFDMEKLTAAHRTLPFGTWVDVHNLTNGKHVTVRITDRGPFIRGRVIDLSKAAAREIEMIGPGLAEVRLTIVAPPKDLPVVAAYAVQVGAFRERERAEEIRRNFESQFGTARIVYRAGNPSVWRVLVGSETTLEGANLLCDRIRSADPRALVVRLDEPETENAGSSR